MGYRVVYGKDEPYFESERIHAGRTLLITVAVGILFLSAVYRLWPEGAHVMEQLRHMGGMEETQAALDALAVRLRSGMDFREAVTAFCRDVVSMGLQYAA